MPNDIFMLLYDNDDDDVYVQFQHLSDIVLKIKKGGTGDDRIKYI